MVSMDKKTTVGLITIIVLSLAVVAMVAAWQFVQGGVMSGRQYVAMGDSVAAGAGLSTADEACGRGSQAYPQIIADQLRWKLTNVSCSGATLTEGVLEPQREGMTSQLDQLFDVESPDVVTLTIGANDLRWYQVLAECTRRLCGHEQDRRQFTGALQLLSDNLQTTLDSIAEHYRDDRPHVYITGYYRLLDEETDLPIENLEANREWIYSAWRQLNTTIEEAANQRDFVSYVDIDFSGHELFTRQSWLQGLRDPAPLHPNSAGQSAIAQQLIGAFHNSP